MARQSFASLLVPQRHVCRPGSLDWVAAQSLRRLVGQHHEAGWSGCSATRTSMKSAPSRRSENSAGSLKDCSHSLTFIALRSSRSRAVADRWRLQARRSVQGTRHTPAAHHGAGARGPAPGPPPPHRWAGRPRPVGLQVGAHRAQIHAHQRRRPRPGRSQDSAARTCRSDVWWPCGAVPPPRSRRRPHRRPPAPRPPARPRAARPIARQIARRFPSLQLQLWTAGTVVGERRSVTLEA